MDLLDKCRRGSVKVSVNHIKKIRNYFKVRTPSPKFGHLPIQLQSKFSHGKSYYAKIVSRPLVLKLFQHSNGNFYIFILACLQQLQTMCA